MNGLTWMDEVLRCPDARKRIPLSLTATLPLPGRQGKDTAECWYYRLERRNDGPWLMSPELHVVWDAGSLTIVRTTNLAPRPLGPADDVLTQDFRRREDDFLQGPFTAFLQGEEMQNDWQAEWIETLPQALKAWIDNELKED